MSGLAYVLVNPHSPEPTIVVRQTQADRVGEAFTTVEGNCSSAGGRSRFSISFIIQMNKNTDQIN
jgi:hypothetical protein